MDIGCVYHFPGAFAFIKPYWLNGPIKQTHLGSGSLAVYALPAGRSSEVPSLSMRAAPGSGKGSLIFQLTMAEGNSTQSMLSPLSDSFPQLILHTMGGWIAVPDSVCSSIGLVLRLVKPINPQF